jgi:hypothetical protein
MQYVTLVRNWTVTGKSHIVEPQPVKAVVETMCGRGWYYMSAEVEISDEPQCKGVCKVCERKNR